MSVLAPKGKSPDHHRPGGGSRWLTTKLTITLAIAVAAATLPAPFSPRSASADELCGWVGQSWACGARWNSHSASWHDNTGWTGSKQTAVSLAGAKWDAVPDTFSLTYDSSPYGPYQATVGIGQPGRSWYPLSRSDLDLHCPRGHLQHKWCTIPAELHVDMEYHWILQRVHEIG